MAAAPNPEHPRVAMIFDDGPTEENGMRLLAILKQADIHVTFGYVAKNVEARPAVARAALAGGHEIANHSYSHQHPKELSDAELSHEVVTAEQIDLKATGVAPKWYWPPFLEVDPRHAALTEKAGIKVYHYPHIVVSEDYRPEVPADEIRRKATTQIEDGCVILMHEWRKETLEQLPAIVADLKKRGCVFLTFSELAAYNATAHPAPR